MNSTVHKHKCIYEPMNTTFVHSSETNGYLKKMASVYALLKKTLKIDRFG